MEHTPNGKIYEIVPNQWRTSKNGEEREGREEEEGEGGDDRGGKFDRNSMKNESAPFTALFARNLEKGGKKNFIHLMLVN